MSTTTPVPGERIYYGGNYGPGSDINPLLIWFRAGIHRTGVDPHLRILSPHAPPTVEPPEQPPSNVATPRATDFHVRRSGEDYAEALAKLLPFGPAWPRDPLAALMKTVRGLAEIWGLVDSRAADLLEQESDPRITLELLPDWERNWGLPDPCYDEPGTIGERQRALVMRMTMQGAQSREFFIEVAATLGYEITISEFRPFVVGMDRCGDNRVIGPSPQYNEWGIPLLTPEGGSLPPGQLSAWPNYGIGPATNRYYWTVHVGKAKQVWFRVGAGGGQTGVDPHLRITTANDLECLLNRWKPAHTIIVFDYSTLPNYDPQPHADGAFFDDGSGYVTQIAH
jgi:uncharacterized protein YmfQ (DUF2313 family)